MAEVFLYVPKANFGFEKMGGVGMAQSMDGSLFVDARLLESFLEGDT